MTREIQSIYFDTVKGVNNTYEEWLTFID